MVVSPSTDNNMNLALENGGWRPERLSGKNGGNG
jgi:hypothetical protein